MKKEDIGIFAAILMRAMILFMIVLGGMAISRLIYTDLDIYNITSTSSDKEPVRALNGIGSIGDNSFLSAGAAVVAFICSIISFRKTSIFSSIVRTTVLGIFAYCFVRAAILFHIMRTAPVDMTNEYLRRMNSAAAFGGTQSVIVYLIAPMILPIFIVTSIFAFIKLFKYPYGKKKEAEKGSWDV